MLSNRLRIIGWLALVCSCSAAHAVVIGGAVRSGGTDPLDPNVVNAPVGLVNGVEAFVDRTHEWENVPGFLTGADYVQIANDDKTAGGFQLQVTLNEQADLYLFLDERVPGGSVGADQTPGRVWMFNGSTVNFKNTNMSLGVDESADGDIDNFSRIFVAPNLGPGTYTLFEQNDGGSRNMYGVAALSAAFDPGPINRAVRTGGNDPLEPQVFAAATGGLQEGSRAFVDRSHIVVNVPTELLGLEYISMANDDRSASQFNLRVELNETSDLFLLIDDRVGDNDNNDGPDLGGGVMDWVLNAGFFDTGLDVGVDESADGSINQFYSVFQLNDVSGSYTFLEQNNGGSRNMYMVAVRGAPTVPEPMTGGLLALSLGALAARSRRRRVE